MRTSDSHPAQQAETARRLGSDRVIPPGPSWFTGLSNMRRLQRDPWLFLSDLHEQFGEVVRIPIATIPGYLVADPDAISYILRDNYKNYSKDTLTYNIARSVSGENILTNDGHDWLRRRRLMQPLFHRNYIDGFADIIVTKTSLAMKRWLGQPQTCELVDEMMSLTLAIAGQCLFGVDMEDVSDELRLALNQTGEETLGRLRSPLAVLWTQIGFPPPRSRRFRTATRFLDETIYRMIEERRGQTNLPYDILSLLLQVQDEETGEGLPSYEIRNEIGVLLAAGHETTALGLTWTWILLCQHPDVAARLRDEVDSVLSGRPPTAQDIPNLPYTRAVFQEALRLYPPVWGFSRRSIYDDRVSGYHIPLRSRIIISPFVTQRSERYWADPEQFAPDRFLVPDAERQFGFAYLPFGLGPRQCIGKPFAMMEAQLILASVVQRLHLQIDSVDVNPSVGATLRPDRPVYVRIEERREQADHF